MPEFSPLSKRRLAECHPDLQKLMNEVIKHYDIVVLCGFRGKDEQDKAFREGKSKLSFPKSKHNVTPSLAVDIAPYPLDWNDLKRFWHLAGYVKATAEKMGIKIRQGADWDGDNDFKDQKFIDLPHVELAD